MGEVKNILVGVGTIKISAPLDTDTFEPDDGETDPTAWRDVGFTIDGLEATFEPDMVDITVDQLGDAAKIVEQSTKLMLKTTLAEATLQNLAVAWGYDDTAASATDPGVYDDPGDTGGIDKTFNIGVFADAIPTERAFYFDGKGPSGKKRTYTAWRIISVASSGHSYKRGEATVFPVELRAIPLSSKTGQEYGKIEDHTS